MKRILFLLAMLFSLSGFVQLNTLSVAGLQAKKLQAITATPVRPAPKPAPKPVIQSTAYLDFSGYYDWIDNTSTVWFPENV